MSITIPTKRIQPSADATTPKVFPSDLTPAFLEKLQLQFGMLASQQVESIRETK